MGGFENLAPYAFTIFLSAFLLFQIQPLIGKYYLPWYGGSPAVWTSCMLFFQSLLLLGYAYGHYLVKRLKMEKQRRLHLAALGLSSTWLIFFALLWNSPLLPDARWKPQPTGVPLIHVLLLLGVSIGLPYLILSATSPLIQCWYGRMMPGRSPYRLYSLSNVGSMLGLITYPVLVEPFLTLPHQALLWTILWGVFAAGSAYCCWQATRRGEVGRSENSAGSAGMEQSEGWNAHSGARSPSQPDLRCDAESRVIHHEAGTDQREEQPGWSRRLFWMTLAACPSILLIATTNQVCQEVAVIPFLWVLPLSLYLFSFILCFDNEKWYRRDPFMALLALTVGATLVALFGGMRVGIFWQVVIFSSLSFAAAMVCHGELVRLKPSPRHLTLFYLWVALGGALGGVFTAIAAPLIFDGYWEFHFGLLSVCLLALLLLWKDKNSWIHRSFGWPAALSLFWVGIIAQAVFEKEFIHTPFGALFHKAYSTTNLLLAFLLLLLLVAGWALRNRWACLQCWPSIIFSVATLLLIASLLWLQIHDTLLGARRVMRNFYGVLTVLDENADDPENHQLRLRHGRITHGLQYQAADRRRFPTAYFGIQSGIGLAMRVQRQRALSAGTAGMNIGFVGLGVGTLAAYAQAGDNLRIYELNPAVADLSSGPHPFFTYYADCPARKSIVLGDARLSMEREAAQNALGHFDVFAIDAFSSDSIPAHLLTREAMAVYLWHLNPKGIIAFHITNQYLNLQPVIYGLADYYHLTKATISSRGNMLTWNSDWILLSRDEGFLSDPLIWSASQVRAIKARPNLLWTDNFSNLFYCLK